MPLSSLLNQGGKVLVIGAFDKILSEYQNNPRIEFWSGHPNQIRTLALRRSLDNIRAVITTRYISHNITEILLPQIRSMRMTYFPMKNYGEIRKLLDEMVQPVEVIKAEAIKVEETKVGTDQPVERSVVKVKKAKFGQVKELYLKYDDVNLSISDSARHILEIAKGAGVQTTLGSLVTGIAVQRRKVGIVARPRPQRKQESEPKPVVTVSESSSTLKMFDDAIIALQLVREVVAKSIQDRELIQKLLQGLK